MNKFSTKKCLRKIFQLSKKHLKMDRGYPHTLIKNYCFDLCPLRRGGGGGTLGISGWGCAAWTLEPLTYTRASSAEFCYPILQ